jgi:hypothetical protein
MSIRRLDLRTIESDDTRVDAFVAALEGESDRSTADDATASGSDAWMTDGFTASGKATGKRPQVGAGWVPQFTASGKVKGKRPG